MITSLVLHNRRGRSIKTIPINFESILRQAEASPGDPIFNLIQLLADIVHEQGYILNVDGQSELQSQIAQVVYDGEVPSELRVLAKDSTWRDNMRKSGNGRMRGEEFLRADGQELFDQIIEYPEQVAKDMYERLVGLEEIKKRLINEASILISPESVEEWSRRYHAGHVISACNALRDRSPFLIFGGDVGTGKTALAESFGHAVAEALDAQVRLYRLSVLTRGSGIVGEMTQRITRAFEFIEQIALESGLPTIFLLDEADTLGQSREEKQMHHEDRAGVNALIQGIDRFRNSQGLVLIVFCTNRVTALDPAIRRRAAEMYFFERPNDVQREEMLQQYLGDLSLTAQQMKELVRITGSENGREYGFTYSDIVNKLIPNAVLQAFPDTPLNYEVLLDIACETEPTRPFNSN